MARLIVVFGLFGFAFWIAQTPTYYFWLSPSMKAGLQEYWHAGSAFSEKECRELAGDWNRTWGRGQAFCDPVPLYRHWFNMARNITTQIVRFATGDLSV